MSLPLEGILVVSVEQAAAAPFASSRLADAGARVIKIERPEGDFARGYDGVVRGESTYYVWLNRGKESVVLDFRQARDAELLRRMMLRADVVIQNLGPGAAERAGFGWRALRQARPDLITCDITGYGETGPLAGSRAYDLMVQAESGLASITGTPDAPGRVGVSAVDIATGMFAHAAILEALLRRFRTGEGASLHVSLFDAMADWMSVPILYFDHTGREWPRVGLGHPTIAPYGAYRLARGDEIMVGVQNDREWVRFAERVLLLPELAQREEYGTNNGRVLRKAELDREVQAVLQELVVDECIARLKRAEVAYARINRLRDVAQHAHLRRLTAETPVGPVDLVAPPAIFREEERSLRAVPHLGEHTEAARLEFFE
ncbi:CoA transferase [Methylobacterium sp. J-030]|uniref:CaiB/BaiF CoA transferase family protein n=1 Tax=Methylobacterium sp. J-030 TaxID=2836627 RepID=UPI001FBB4D2D|nr:CaiB/BaiF CoA-transferase family protein [Methylobacterium sp. J-030]MCJ2072200.1 CoA transferase [Methylobacterium sp. J-030]